MPHGECNLKMSTNNNYTIGGLVSRHKPVKQRTHGKTKKFTGGRGKSHRSCKKEEEEGNIGEGKFKLLAPESDSCRTAAIPLPELSFVASALIVAALGLASHWNGRHGDFVFDDSEAIVTNGDLRPEVPVWSLFGHDFWGEPIAAAESHKSYRPLTVLSFRMNYYMAGGLHPRGFHLVNILLHAVLSVMVLPVSSALISAPDLEGGAAGKRGDVWLMAAPPRSSLLCAVLFAVHPIHTENVAGVVGRADLLCAFFFFLSFLMYVSACRKDSSCLDSYIPVFLPSCQLILSMILCAISMLCKEQGITVIGICSIYDIITNCGIDPISACQASCASLRCLGVWPSVQNVLQSPEKGWLRRLLCRHVMLTVSALLLLWLRFTIMGSGVPTFQPVDNPASFADSFWIRVINYSYVYSLNAWLLLFPWWLCFDWSMGCVPLIQTPLDLRVVAPVIFWITLSCLLFLCLLGADHYVKRTLTISLAMIVVPFLPASNVFFRVGFVIAERVLYLPSLGYCLTLTLGINCFCATNKSAIIKKTVQGLLLVIVACHVARCIHRNEDWLTEERLYHAGLKVCPQNAKVHFNIGKVAADQGHVQEAIVKYREAIRLNPEYDQALNNLGNILKEQNQTEEAEALITKAVQLQPKFAAAWMNLGIVQAVLQKHKEAEDSYRTALRHRKNYPDCYFNLGNLFLAVGNADRALSAWLNATSLLNTHADSWSNALRLLESLVFHHEHQHTAWT